MADSLAKQVINYLKKNPKATNQDLYEKYPGVRKNTLRHYKSKFATVETAPKKAVKAKTTKAKKGAAKKKVDKKAQKVVAYLKKNPKTTYDQLFAEFPTETKVSLKAIKQEFKKTATSKTQKSAKASVASKTKGTTKKAVKAKTVTPAKTKTKAKSPKVKARKAPVAKKAKKVSKPKVVTAEKKALQVAKKTPSDAISRIAALEKKVHQLTSALADATKKIQTPIMKTMSSKKPSMEKIKDLEEHLLSFIKNKRDKVSGELHNLEELQRMVSDKIAGFVSSRSNKNKD